MKNLVKSTAILALYFAASNNLLAKASEIHASNFSIEANPSDHLESLGKKALETCKALSGNLDEKIILQQMEGKYSLKIYAARIKHMLTIIGKSCMGQTTSQPLADETTIQAIIHKVIPTLKQLITQLLELPETTAQLFWIQHSKDIIGNLENELRQRLTQQQGDGVLYLLNQEHFEPFMHIIGQALQHHLNLTPSNHKGMIIELRETITAYIPGNAK
jgi:hypothetical protein